MTNEEAIEILEVLARKSLDDNNSKEFLALVNAVTSLKNNLWMPIEYFPSYAQPILLNKRRVNPIISDCGKYFFDLCSIPQPPQKGE